MNKCLLAVAVIWWIRPATVASAAMILQSHVPQRHDRFHDPSDPAKAFLGDPHDFSGVGRNLRWATMVSPSYFVSAAHFRPADGSTLYFYTTNDPAETPHSRTVESGRRIAGSDLWLGRLTQPVGPQIEHYPILSLPERSDYDDRQIYTFGLSVGRFSATPTTVRLGRNHIDPGSIAPVTEGEPPNQVTGISYLFDFDDPGGAGSDESYLQSGDSGGPSFILHNGAPALVGVHWFIWEDEANPSIYGSGDTFLPEYLAEIDAAMDGQRVTVVSSALTWDGQGDGDWDSPDRWDGTATDRTPDATNPAVVHSDRVAVGADAAAYSLSIQQGGRLAVRRQNTLETVRHAEIADGTLRLAPDATLQAGGEVTMQASSHYVCELDGPEGGVIWGAGDVHLGGTLSIEALGKLNQVPPGEIQWFGDQTRTIIQLAQEGLSGSFDHLPPAVPELPDHTNHGQGHLGHGVFLTNHGPHGQAVIYAADAVQVDLLQAADGDTNGDRTVQGRDIQAILSAAKFATGVHGDWTEGDFNADTIIDGRDIQAILATALFDTGPYAAMTPPPDGDRAGGTPEASLIVTPVGLLIDTADSVLTGYLVRSAQGIFTGRPAENLGWFTEDTDARISDGLGFTLTGSHRLGRVIGREFSGVDPADDLTFTYTLDGKPGVYHGRVIVPEPSAWTMLAAGLPAVAWIRRMRRRRSRHRLIQTPPSGITAVRWA